MTLRKKIVFQICLFCVMMAIAVVGIYLIIGRDGNKGGGIQDPFMVTEENHASDTLGVDNKPYIEDDGVDYPTIEPTEDELVEGEQDHNFTVYHKLIKSGSSVSSYNNVIRFTVTLKNNNGSSVNFDKAPGYNVTSGYSVTGGTTSSSSVGNVYWMNYSFWSLGVIASCKRFAFVNWYTCDSNSWAPFGFSTVEPTTSNWTSSYTSYNYNDFYIYNGGTTTSSSTAQNNAHLGVQGTYWICLRSVVNVYYYANGGSGAPSSGSGYAGIAYTLSSTKPTRTGYTFLGWSTSSTATSATWSAGGKIANTAMTDYSKSLYAVWSINTYSVWNYLYYKQGVTTAPSSYNITANSSLTNNYNHDSGSYLDRDYTKTYSTSSYWITFSASRSGCSYYMSTSSSPSTSSYVDSYTWYWTANADYHSMHIYVYQRYTITYNGNGYTGGSMPGTQYKAYGVNVTLSSSKPTRTGYDFLGWSTSSTATSASYASGGTYSTNANLSLYAVWKPITYTIAYNRNESAYSNRSSLDTVGGSTASSTHTYNTSKALTSNGFTMTNWSFQGWATSSTGSVAYSNGQSVVNLRSTAGTYNLYAKWAPITISVKVNIVTYDTSGNSSSTVGGTASITYDNSTSAVTTATQSAATATYTAHKQQSFKVTASAKSGYTLIGVTSSSSCPTSATNTSGYTWNPTANTTYYVYFRQRSAYRMQKTTETVDSSSKTKYYISSTTLGWAPQTKVATPSGLSTDGTFTVPGVNTFTVYKDGSGNKYVYAGGAYFKFEPIVWLVSTGPNYGVTATNISVVSEKILFAARYNSSTSLSEGWSYKSSELYTWSTNIQTALNLGTNLKSKTWAGTKYAAAGTEGKVAADNYTASAAQIASMSEIEANYATSFSGNRNAYCTDFAYYLMTGSTTMPSNVSDRYIDCWTRDLANQRGTASYYRIAPNTANTTAALIKDTGFVNQVKGIRLSAYMTTATYY